MAGKPPPAAVAVIHTNSKVSFKPLLLLLLLLRQRLPLLQELRLASMELPCA
jgi:hypothetical protein